MFTNVKMAETIETMPETNETIPEKVEENAPPPPENVEEPATKKRGRPKGASDKAPRRKKITIVETPIVREPEVESVAQSSHETPAPKVKAKPQAPRVEVAAPAPPSPRTTMREASKNILQLQTLRDFARKSHLMNAYTQGLHTY